MSPTKVVSAPASQSLSTESDDLDEESFCEVSAGSVVDVRDASDEKITICPAGNNPNLAVQPVPGGHLRDEISDDDLSDNGVDGTASSEADGSSLLMIEKWNEFTDDCRTSEMSHDEEAIQLQTSNDDDDNGPGVSGTLDTVDNDDNNDRKDPVCNPSDGSVSHGWTFRDQTPDTIKWYFNEKDADAEPSADPRKRPDPIWRQYPEDRYPRFDMELKPTECDGTEAVLASRAYPMPQPGSSASQQVWVIVSPEFPQFDKQDDDDESSVEYFNQN
ncbi:hypothetical protein ACHAQH_008645 [Verticillium albo-atrum]